MAAPCVVPPSGVGARNREIEYASRVAHLKVFRLGTKLAKPNYQFAKRQRDLAKKQKKEQKKLKKALPGEPDPTGDADPASEADTAAIEQAVLPEVKTTA